MVNGSVHQGDITILNVYISNNKASKCMKQKLINLQGKIDKSTILVGDFNTPLSITDRTSRQKISKHTVDLSSAMH